MPVVKNTERPVINCEDGINDAYKQLLYCESRWLVLYGGGGSGKSHFAAQKILIRTMFEEGHKFVVTRKVGTSLRESVYALLNEYIHNWGVEDFWVINKSEMKFTYLPNGNEILCKGLDDVEKIKSIAGITGFWHEEATEMTPHDLIQLNLRLRGETAHYKQHILSFNPIATTHWLKKRFFGDRMVERGKSLSYTVKKEIEDGKIIEVSTTLMRTTYLDNRFIDDEYKLELISLKDEDETYYEIYALGMWGNLKNIIYGPFPQESWPMRVVFDRKPDDPTHDEEPYAPEESFGGIDFGYVNPTVFMLFDQYEGKFYANELIYQSGMTVTQLADRMDELEIPKTMPIYCDSADPGAIEELRQRGYNVFPADKGPGSVVAGIKFVKAQDIITREENVNFNKEAGSYRWREDKDGVVVEDPIKLDDHAMDAMRYAIYTHLRLVIPEEESVYVTDLEEIYDEALFADEHYF